MRCLEIKGRYSLSLSSVSLPLLLYGILPVQPLRLCKDNNHTSHAGLALQPPIQAQPYPDNLTFTDMARVGTSVYVWERCTGLQPLKQSSRHLCQNSSVCLQETLTNGPDIPSKKDPPLRFHPFLPVTGLQFCPNCTWPRGIWRFRWRLRKVNRGELSIYRGSLHPSWVKTLQ